MYGERIRLIVDWDHSVPEIDEAQRMERGAKSTEKGFGSGDFMVSNFLQDFVVGRKISTTAMEANLTDI